MKDFFAIFNINKKIGLLLITSSFILGGLLAGGFISILNGMPQIRELQDYKPSIATTVYSIDGREVIKWYIERRIPVPLGRIPRILIQAVIAVEDKNFYTHGGLDWLGILRAAWINIKAGRIVQGGSTITQQLSKVLFLTPERSFRRKVKEAFLSLQIERLYQKDDILELYLNQIYYGSGAYGVQSAAQTFFGKDIRELNLCECALISGLPKGPSIYSPFFHPERAIIRRRHVLSRMLEEGIITDEEFNKSVKAPLGIIEKKAHPTPAPYFLEKVRQDLESLLGPNLLYKGGLNVYTTLDLEAQEIAERAVEEGLANIEKRRADRVHSRTDADNEDTECIENSQMENLPLQAALIAIDTENGYVLCEIGGRDFNKSRFNRATQAKRQPGSAFKPVIYTAAIQNGFTPADIIIDSPVIYKIPGSMEPWKPENFENKFYGPVRIRTALENSINVATVKLMDKIGITTAIQYARLLGIKSELHPYPSLALGTFEVTLQELTGAYIPFANLGMQINPIYIRHVTNSFGETIYESFSEKKQVITPATAYIMCSLLQGVIQNGTGKLAKDAGPALGGKTGTTDNFSDAWFIGFSPQVVAGVWVGYDEKICIGEKETGAKAALPIWKMFMKNYMNNKPAWGFKEPDDIVFIPIDPSNGLRAPKSFPEPLLEVFQRGNEPEEYSHDQIENYIGTEDYYLTFIE